MKTISFTINMGSEDVSITAQYESSINGSYMVYLNDSDADLANRSKAIKDSMAIEINNKLPDNHQGFEFGM